MLKHIVEVVRETDHAGFERKVAYWLDKGYTFEGMSEDSTYFSAALIKYPKPEEPICTILLNPNL